MFKLILTKIKTGGSLAVQIKKIIPRVMISILLALIPMAQAQAAPLVDFDRFNTDAVASFKYDEEDMERGVMSGPWRNLGMDEDAFKTYKNVDHPKSKHKIHTQNGYQVISLNEGKGADDYRSQYAYVIHNQQVFGYILMNPLEIRNDEQYPNSPIRAMKQLPAAPGLLTGLQIPSGIQMAAYEQRHGGFVERYVFARFVLPRTGQELYTLLVEAYYPESLDQAFTKDMKNYIKRFVKDVS